MYCITGKIMTFLDVDIYFSFQEAFSLHHGRGDSPDPGPAPPQGTAPVSRVISILIVRYRLETVKVGGLGQRSL